MSDGRPLIIVHRGLAHRVPENTTTNDPLPALAARNRSSCLPASGGSLSKGERRVLRPL
jgi:hypothetical protein